MPTTGTILIYVAVLISLVQGAIINFEQAGALPLLTDDTTATHNTVVFNQVLAQLQQGDTLFFPPKLFFLMGGVKGTGLRNVTLQFDGILRFSDNQTAWPRDPPGCGLIIVCLRQCLVLHLIPVLSSPSPSPGTPRETYMNA